MTMVAGQFHEVASAVARRTADLLRAGVWIADQHGAIIAGSVPDALPVPLFGGSRPPDVHALRVPINLDSRQAEVVIGEQADGEAISPRLVHEIVRLVVDQMAVVERLPHRQELKNRFIHDLLRGAETDEDDVRREGQILGMDFSRPRAVILIDASDFILSRSDKPWCGTARQGDDQQLDRSALRARLVIGSVVSFFHLPNDTICGYVGEGEVAVLKASSTHDLEGWSSGEPWGDAFDPSWANLAALKRAASGLLARLRRDSDSTVSIGIGRYHPVIAGIARSYEDARAALSLGRRYHGENQVHCLDELGIPALVCLSDPRTKLNLARHLLSSLDDEPELLQTLDAFFFENCCMSSTAARLSIHRNTLSYRLDKIASLAGLDPRRFDDAVKIRLALLLRDAGAQHGALCTGPIHGD